MVLGFYQRQEEPQKTLGASALHPAKIPESRKHKMDWLLLEVKEKKKKEREKNMWGEIPHFNILIIFMPHT
jgi:hypothetical protein